MAFCLSISSAMAFGKGVFSLLGRYRFRSFWSLDLGMVAIKLFAGEWIRISVGFVGCCVISCEPVAIVSKSGFFCCVVYVVCWGCHPRGWCGGVGGCFRVFFCFGAVFFL